MTPYAENLQRLGIAAAFKFGVPAEWVLGIIGAESSFDPDSNRATWEANAGEYSYGVMQVLGSTARGLGHRGDLSELLDPATGIEYGVRQLADLIRRYGRDEASILSAYNVGHPDTQAGAGYLSRVYQWMNREQADTGGPGLVIFGVVLVLASLFWPRAFKDLGRGKWTL